jgi:hypothetical protein
MTERESQHQKEKAELEAAPQTQPPRRLPRKSNLPFERVPIICREALERGELDLAEFAVLSFLILKIDYRDGEAALSLRGLHDLIRWPWSEDHLRKKLLSLREKEWLAYDSTPGKRTAYIFRHGPKLHEALNPAQTSGATSDETSPSEREVWLANEVNKLNLLSGSGSGSESGSGEEEQKVLGNGHLSETSPLGRSVTPGRDFGYPDEDIPFGDSS